MFGKKDEHTSVPDKSIKCVFIYKDDPHFGLEVMSSDGADDFITLVDHDNLGQLSLLNYDDVQDGPFNLNKFYVIPVEGDELTYKEYADFMFYQGYWSW